MLSVINTPAEQFCYSSVIHRLLSDGDQSMTCRRLNLWISDVYKCLNIIPNLTSLREMENTGHFH